MTRDDIDPGKAGMALNFALLLTFYLTGYVFLAAEVEARFSSVERIHEFSTTVKPETNTSLLQGTQEECAIASVDESWPLDGAVDVTGLTVTYEEHLPPTLRDITFKVLPRQKLAIVGRTGSGKSTITNALFRIIPVPPGMISIDGVDIASLSLSKLRSSIAIIPQEPILFSGTIRSNVDIVNAVDDDVVTEALERVGVSKAIGEGAGEQIRGGSLLDFEVADGGQNLSIGTRQLVCVARAMVQQSKIVVLDEATSSLDLEADAMVQEAIQTHFGDATLFVIAHRLHTVMRSCDLVMVLHDGVMADFGTPAELLSQGGAFAELVDATGPETCSALRAMAAK